MENNTHLSLCLACCGREVIATEVCLDVLSRRELPAFAIREPRMPAIEKWLPD